MKRTTQLVLTGIVIGTIVFLSQRRTGTFDPVDPDADEDTEAVAETDG